MKILYDLIGNYAVTMIVFTILIKLATFPLAINQQKSTAKMSVFQPLINEIQTKYKNNPEKQQEELLKLQQEHGYNPMSGCLPMLLNMLILFGIIGVVYYPVQYIFSIPKESIEAACTALGLATTNPVTMQTALIQALHSGATVSPDILSAAQVSALQNFNTMFMGMDMCEIPGLHLTPLIIFPVISAVTMFIQYGVSQKLSGAGAQMQGSMKVMMFAMNFFFVYYCFNAPIGFSLYYSVSNLCMIVQSFVTYKIYSPEKFKAQYEEELAAKRAAKKQKKTVTVKENGKSVEREVTTREADRIRLEAARKLDEEIYKYDRTTPKLAEEE